MTEDMERNGGGRRAGAAPSGEGSPDARIAPGAPAEKPADSRIAPGAPAASAAAPSRRRPLSSGQRVGLAAAVVAAAALIAVSAFFLFSPGGGGAGSAGLLRTTASPSASSAAVSSSSAAGSSSASAAPSAGGEADADGGSSEQGAAGSTLLVQGGAETAVAPGAGGQPAEPPAPAPERDVVTVTVSVTSATVGDPVSAGPVRFTFERGATALDALAATGLSVNASSSAFGGSYVSAIGGLAEDPSKGAWGWKYSVNGVDPQMSSGLYALEDGDVVEWRYVTDLDG